MSKSAAKRIAITANLSKSPFSGRKPGRAGFGFNKRLDVFYNDESLKAVAFGFGVGQELSEHTASTAAVMHFLRGEADVTQGDQETHVGEGTWIHMPPALPHSILAKTPVVKLLLLLKAK